MIIFNIIIVLFGDIFDTTIILFGDTMSCALKRWKI